MHLSEYLSRIRFTGSVRPDLATLNALYRAHQHAVPFENLDVQLRRSSDTHLSLRGRVLVTTHSSHVEKSLLHSARELVQTLRERFDLDVPQASTLWPSICARHEALFGDNAAASHAR